MATIRGKGRLTLDRFAPYRLLPKTAIWLTENTHLTCRVLPMISRPDFSILELSQKTHIDAFSF
jgi:hypothetical protein